MDVEKAIDDMPFGGLHRRLIALVGGVVLLDGFDIQLAAFAAPTILHEWGLGTAALGPAMAGALVGMAIGTGIGGMLGDRVGRRPALIIATIWFAVATMLTALAADATSFAALRLLAGLGLGAAVPNAAALAAEWMPARLRNLAVTAIIVAVPCGGMLGAGLSAWLIPAAGWRLTFVIAGALRKLLGRAGIAAPAAESRSPRWVAAGRDRLLAPALRRSTVGLGISFFASMLVLYAYLSWLPVLLSRAGASAAAAILGSMVFNLCGVAVALLMAAAMSRVGSLAALLATCGLAALASFWLASSIAAPAASVAMLLAAAGGAGAGALTLQVSLYALAAHAFPPSVRASGIGYAASVGRLGAIASAFGAGTLLELGSGQALFFGGIAGAIAVAASGILLIDRHIPASGGFKAGARRA